MKPEARIYIQRPVKYKNKMHQQTFLTQGAKDAIEFVLC